MMEGVLTLDEQQLDGQFLALLHGASPVAGRRAPDPTADERLMALLATLDPVVEHEQSELELPQEQQQSPSPTTTKPPGLPRVVSCSSTSSSTISIASSDDDLLALLEAADEDDDVGWPISTPSSPPPAPASPAPSSSSSSSSLSSSKASSMRPPRKARSTSSTGRPRKINLSRERMRQELVDLRKETAELEKQLQILRQQRQVRTELLVSTQTSGQAGPPLDPVQQEAIVATIARFWARNADRERLLRQTAVVENRRLRRKVEDCSRIARTLQHFLHQQAMEARLTDEQRLCRFMDRLHFDESERAVIDGTLSKNFSAMHQQLDNLLRSSGLADVFTEFQEFKPRPTPPGFGTMIEFQDARILPYKVSTTDTVAWRCLQAPETSPELGVYLAEECVDGLLRTKFAHVAMIHDQEVQCRGRMVARRHVEDKRIVLFTGTWMSAEGGPLGADRIEIIDESWSVLETLPGTDYTIAKDWALSRTRIPEAVTLARQAELQELAMAVHSSYYEGVLYTYEQWESFLMQEGPRM